MPALCTRIDSLTLSGCALASDCGAASDTMFTTNSWSARSFVLVYAFCHSGQSTDVPPRRCDLWQVKLLVACGKLALPVAQKRMMLGDKHCTCSNAQNGWGLSCLRLMSLQHTCDTLHFGECASVDLGSVSWSRVHESFACMLEGCEYA